MRASSSVGSRIQWLANFGTPRCRKEKRKNWLQLRSPGRILPKLVDPLPERTVKNATCLTKPLPQRDTPSSPVCEAPCSPPPPLPTPPPRERNPSLGFHAPLPPPPPPSTPPRPSPELAMDAGRKRAVPEGTNGGAAVKRARGEQPLRHSSCFPVSLSLLWMGFPRVSVPVPSPDLGSAGSLRCVGGEKPGFGWWMRGGRLGSVRSL